MTEPTGVSDAIREPWWQVLAIFDEEGEGRDFAYTHGLAERGLPEVHMWARPTAGEDPGADWRFSHRDMMALLNAVAWRLVDGRTAPGDSWEEAYDAGLVTVRFELAQPTDAEELEAFQAAPGQVLPLRWSLHRAPEGDLAPMPIEVRMAGRVEFSVLVERLPERAALPEGWELPETPSWDPEQRWGPRTPLVLAHAASITTMSARALRDLVNLTFPLEHGHLAAYPQLVALAAAREAGRTRCLERLAEDAQRLVADIGIGWAVAPWRTAVAWLDSDAGGAEGGDPFPQDLLRRMLGRVIASHLLTVAVADLLDDEQVIAGTGPVSSVLVEPGVPPDSRWTAAPHVVGLVSDLTVMAGPEATARAAHAWAMAHDDEAATARGELAVLSSRTASVFPPFRDTLPRGFLRDLWEPALVRGVSDQLIQEWLTVLATVLTHRARLSVDVVDPVLRRGSPFVPGLGAALNSPMAAGG